MISAGRWGPVGTPSSKQPSGLDISKKGDLALVTNRADNSISILSISGKDVKVIDTVAMGDSVAHVAISPDGTKALAVKPVVNKVAFLKIGTSLKGRSGAPLTPGPPIESAKAT